MGTDVALVAGGTVGYLPADLLIVDCPVPADEPRQEGGGSSLSDLQGDFVSRRGQSSQEDTGGGVEPAGSHGLDDRVGLQRFSLDHHPAAPGVVLVRREVLVIVRVVGLGRVRVKVAPEPSLVCHFGYPHAGKLVSQHVRDGDVDVSIGPEVPSTLSGVQEDRAEEAWRCVLSRCLMNAIACLTPIRPIGPEAYMEPKTIPRPTRNSIGCR